MLVWGFMPIPPPPPPMFMLIPAIPPIPPIEPIFGIPPIPVIPAIPKLPAPPGPSCGCDATLRKAYQDLDHAWIREVDPLTREVQEVIRLHLLLVDDEEVRVVVVAAVEVENAYQNSNLVDLVAHTIIHAIHPITHKTRTINHRLSLHSALHSSVSNHPSTCNLRLRALAEHIISSEPMRLRRIAKSCQESS
ncbi:hypothetical protein LENED_003838 [Lentinula edodes]|uniref:Uncharacterized protein n=1 Tax=Lentinula edodes TaxID=5353 RepID=A0A1Q3E4V8_LENED|nr:hypothetical protein LENED_003838 [Lentinula edodes]